MLADTPEEPDDDTVSQELLPADAWATRRSVWLPQVRTTTPSPRAADTPPPASIARALRHSACKRTESDDRVDVALQTAHMRTIWY